MSPKPFQLRRRCRARKLAKVRGRKELCIWGTQCVFFFLFYYFIFFSNELNYNRQVMATSFGWRFSGGSQNPDSCSFFNIREKGDGRGVWDCGWYTYDDRRERPAVRNKPGWKTNVEARESRSFGLCGGSFSGNGLGNDGVFRSKVLSKLLS